jgi:hypothetical protein
VIIRVNRDITLCATCLKRVQRGRSIARASNFPMVKFKILVLE